MAKYNQADLDKMAKSGEAMPDGSYPIADKEDLQNAIHAVGRGGASHDAIRRHIISRAKALGASDMIPDTWGSDGSLTETNSAEVPESCTRSVPFHLLRAEPDGDGLTFSGYAAVFNSPTLIRGEGPDFMEQIAPGAFRRTIAAGKPVLMFDHGQHPLIGSMPLGKITSLREDARGLFVEARLHDNWLIEPVRDAIASGAIDGMSFRFSTPKDKQTWDYSGDMPFRTVHEVKMPELGPVVFPAYKDTTASVRSLGLLEDEEDIDVDERAQVDEDEAVQPGLVEQIKALVVALLQDEAAELSEDPDATGSLMALLQVLGDLDWFVAIDAAEDQDMTDDQMNSTSLQPAALRGTWKWNPLPADPPDEGTQRSMTTTKDVDNAIALLRLRSPRKAA